MNLSALSMAIALLAGPVVAMAQDLGTSFENLKDAESKKDAALVKKLAAETCALARQMSSEPAPQAADEKEAWASRVAYAKEVEVHTEYSLFATAVQSPPATLVELISALEQQNPKSKYLNDAYGFYFAALGQTGAAEKVPAIAEKALANFPENEDLLLLLADTAVNRKQTDRALGYATRLTAAINRHPKPEGASADWERRRTATLARGYWIAGVIYGDKNQYANADKTLRAALPLIKGNDAMMGPALFYLGLANYNLGKMTLNKARVLEGAKFSEQAAAITGPYAQQAWLNAKLMKDDAAKMR